MPTVAETCPRLKEKLNRAMELRGLSQAALARRASSDVDYKITPQSLSRYLNEGAAPRPDVSLRLAKALDVDVIWLIDEQEVWVDPPPPFGLTISAASNDVFFKDGSRRYAIAAEHTTRILEVAQQIGNGFELAALRILTPVDEGELPEAAQNIIAMCMHIDRCEYELEKLRSFYHPLLESHAGQGFGLQLNADSRIDPKVLIGKIKTIHEEHPGFKAITCYMTAKSPWYSSGEEVAARLDFFWKQIAPYHAARIVDHPALADYAHRNAMRAELIKLGYIDDKGNAVPPPEEGFIWPIGKRSFDASSYFDDDIPDETGAIKQVKDKKKRH